jgi:hypothetical protein
VLDGAALNITVLSYEGMMDFGAIACSSCVPDIWDIADGFAEAVDELKRRAQGGQPPRRRRAKPKAASGGRRAAKEPRAGRASRAREASA